MCFIMSTLSHLRECSESGQFAWSCSCGVKEVKRLSEANSQSCSELVHISVSAVCFILLFFEIHFQTLPSSFVCCLKGHIYIFLLFPIFWVYILEIKWEWLGGIICYYINWLHYYYYYYWLLDVFIDFQESN